MAATQPIPVQDLKQKISQASSILIVLPSQLTIDTVAAGLAFYLSLKQTFAENNEPKRVSIVTPAEVTVAYQRLYGVGDLTKSLGSKDLVISFNVNTEAIEQITRSEDTQKLSIVVEMKKGTPRLSKDQVEFSYRGVDADLIITLGITNPNQVQELLTAEPAIFADRETVVVTTSPQASFGSMVISEPEASGYSEVVAKLIRFLKLSVEGDICTNLLAGIEAATQDFAVKAQADTFAAVSWCLRQGGQRKHLTGMQPSPLAQTPYNRVQFPAPVKPAPPVQPSPEIQESSPTAPPSEPFTSPGQSSVPQPDWFGPKIFRSGEEEEEKPQS